MNHVPPAQRIRVHCDVFFDQKLSIATVLLEKRTMTIIGMKRNAKIRKE
jgi:hypothetical protein